MSRLGPRRVIVLSGLRSEDLLWRFITQCTNGMGILPVSGSFRRYPGLLPLGLGYLPEEVAYSFSRSAAPAPDPYHHAALGTSGPRPGDATPHLVHEPWAMGHGSPRAMGHGALGHGPWAMGLHGPWAIGPWVPGSMGPWSMGPWSMGPWVHGSMDPWVSMGHGSMGPWAMDT